MSEAAPRRCDLDQNGQQLTYFYDDAFPGRPTVVLLHGLSSNHTTWAATQQALHDLKINSLAPDLRGHGYSDKTKRRSLYTVKQLATDLEAIIDQEKIKRCALVGYSYGGPIALEYASAHPQAVGELVLISVNHRSPLGYWHLGWFKPIGYGALQLLSFLLLWQKRRQYLYFRSDQMAGYWHSVWVGLNTMPLAVNFWLLSEMVRLDVAETLPKIRSHTVLVRGEHDPFVTKREIKDMQALLPRSEVVDMGDTGHFIAHHPEVITNLITKHLKLK